MKKRMIVLGLSAAFLAAMPAVWGDVQDKPSPVVAGGNHVELPLDQPAPEIETKTLDGKNVTLASLKGKPVVLEFGSITDPWFRARVDAVEKLAGKYKDKATFVVIYQREAHAADTPEAIEENATDGFAVTKPTSQEERFKLATQARDRLHIANAMLVVDSWSNTSSLRYGGYPNMAFVIDANGKLAAGHPWMDPKKVQGALDALLAGRPVPQELRGPVHVAGKDALDYESMGMEMSGYGQAAKLANVLDKVEMTDDQKKAVLPPLLAFLTDLRNFRETRNGKAPTTQKGAAANGAKAEGTKTMDADDLQAAIQKLRESAKKAKDAVQGNLPEKDAKAIMDAIDQGPAHRLFADN